MGKALKDMHVEEFAKYVEFIPDWRLDEIIASLEAAAKGYEHMIEANDDDEDAVKTYRRRLGAIYLKLSIAREEKAKRAPVS